MKTTTESRAGARYMTVLAFNCGSSSLKYVLLRMPEEKELAGGEAQRVGPPTARPSEILHRSPAGERREAVRMPDLPAAFRAVMDLLAREGHPAPEALGHRIVHGGAGFGAAARIDDAVMAALDRTCDMAPIHNPPAITLVRACRELYPRLPQVAVFDTAFHATIPDYAYTYALPRALCAEHGLRKYGFHGISHQFVVAEAARFLGRPLDRFAAVSCHLGTGGASLCAVRDGQSRDNTMGYSPLPGLMMSTRCGDLDPALPLRLLARTRGDDRLVEKILNQQSGVLGASGSSSDLRDLLAAHWNGPLTDERAYRTITRYLWRLRKYLGAYLASVGRAEAIIFTDTLGELSPTVRQAACADLEAFGVKLDAARNLAPGQLPADIAAPDSLVRIAVIHTNEELSIARQVYRLLGENDRRRVA